MPAKLRHVVDQNGSPLLEGTVILNRGLEGCLTIYPEAEWANIQNRLATLDFTNEDFRYFGRRFYSGVATVSPDKNGRILVPQNLITHAGLQKELLVIGLNRWVEVWDPQRFQYYLQQYKGGTYEQAAGRLFTGKHDEPSE